MPKQNELFQSSLVPGKPGSGRLAMTNDELIARLNEPEWSDLECKKSEHGVSEDAYRSVSAFANTTGGTLVFGVKDSHGQLEVVGVSEPDKVQNDFLSALRTGDKLNRRISVKEERFEHDGKTLLVFHIPEALRSEKPVYLKGDIRQSYIRRGASDEQCTQTEIERFLRDAAAERYDSQAVGYDPNTCFDHHSLAWYRSRYESRPNNRSYAEASDSDFLFQLGLIRDTPQAANPPMRRFYSLAQTAICVASCPAQLPTVSVLVSSSAKIRLACAGWTVS